MLYSAPTQSYVKGSFIVYVALMLALLLVGCSPKHMVTMDIKPPLAARPDMALLIIVRTTSMYGGGEVFDNYLDGKMIGQTAGKGYFMTDIAPGSHYIMAHAQNWVVARMNFEAGKVYILNQWVIYGFPRARTGFSAMTAEDSMKHISERGSDYFMYNKSTPGEDMSARDFEELKNNFEKEVKEEPDRHKDTLEYRGYNKL
jgi:hypothetical protein